MHPTLLSVSANPPAIDHGMSIVSGSHGHIVIDRMTGAALTYQPFRGTSEYASICDFDVDEYVQHYGLDELPQQIDILNIGYWTETETLRLYEPPLRPRTDS